MPIYLTEQYSKAVEKLYTHTSFLRPHCKAHVDMIGKKTCKVYQILTSELNDYKREGKDRYGVPNDEGMEALKLLARLEGILLDPVYTGKAMAGLIDGISQKRF